MIPAYSSYSRSRATAPTSIRLLELVYVSRTKSRGNSTDRSAVGWMDDRWSVIFPEQVLRDWFEAGLQAPGQPERRPTLFMVLMLPGADGSPDEVRAAYRRLAKVTHPDVCRDGDAAEQFKAVQHAYEVLSDPLKRRKYEAGLRLEATMGKQPMPSLGPFGSLYVGNSGPDPNGYRAPLRSGYVLAEGIQNPKWFVVSRLLQWADITDDRGRTLISSFPYGANEPEVVWA